MSRSSSDIVNSLRKLISDGHYCPGERVAELHVAEKLGVSRTPVRLAFRTLEQEGLLQRAGKRGYVVREFTEEDVQIAVEVRGALEGLAARRLAERGLSQQVAERLQECLHQGEVLLGKGYITEDDIATWSDINRRFHETLVASTGSQVIQDAINKNNHLPFASADSIIIDTEALDSEYQKLRMAQMHHRLVYQALSHGEGARAEMLMREHAYVGLRYVELLGMDPTATE
ncbi:GntR family transcriptional regulator [Halomonas binhaiensis]|uniref:GntR family transcriptional regulator n=1 Tax=Halomonas binhaiensis TaxID=2562282 RepID=A0A5C1NMU7_9GAMM|nr:GntR family transcriptional regulator [Halomonas binhaiensis]QEM83767.1 GntR family transcriptional regulator [Halomonas binhaiensis]